MFVIHHIIRSGFVRRVSNGIFVFLLLVFVQVCLMLLMADSTLDLLVGLVFSFSLKYVQFLQEELSLSHLHMLSHTCFCPGGLPCCFFPPDIPHHLVCSCPFWLLWQCSVCMWVLSWGGASVAAPACSLVCSLFLCPTDPAEGQSGQPQVNDAPVALEESDGRRV